MRLERARRKPHVRHTEDVILFRVGVYRFAIAAAAVDEIRNLDGLQPRRAGYMSKLAKVTHTLVRQKKDRERTYFVVDASMQFQLPKPALDRVLVLSGAGAAVLVGSIERMTQINAVQPLPKAFSGAERDWYRGLAIVEKEVVPVVDPGAFLNKGELAVLHAGAAGAATA